MVLGTCPNRRFQGYQGQNLLPDRPQDQWSWGRPGSTFWEVALDLASGPSRTLSWQGQDRGPGRSWGPGPPGPGVPGGRRSSRTSGHQGDQVPMKLKVSRKIKFPKEFLIFSETSERK